MYEKYKGVEITNTYFTGHASQVMSTLNRSISAILRQDRQWSGFYIGIASGIDYWRGLTRRVDDYKLQNGVKRMYLLYETSSQPMLRSIERQLEARYAQLRPASILNRTGGGAGRPSSGPKFFLYLAVAP